VLLTPTELNRCTARQLLESTLVAARHRIRGRRERVALRALQLAGLRRLPRHARARLREHRGRVARLAGSGEYGGSVGHEVADALARRLVDDGRRGQPLGGELQTILVVMMWVQWLVCCLQMFLWDVRDAGAGRGWCDVSPECAVGHTR
jgi:hypothetical protein